MNIKGKRILITGGAVRIGKAFVHHFAQQGAQIIIHCHRSVKEAAALLQDIGGTAAGHTMISADLTASDMTHQLFLPNTPIDILINNASTYDCFPFVTEPETAARQTFEINFWAPYRLIRAFAAQCPGEGCVINLADRDVELSIAAGSSYGLSKKALTELTRLTARELAPQIRVNAIAPGPVLPPVNNPDADMSKTSQRLPLKRPVSLAEMMLSADFLITNDAVTGQILYTDCGHHLIGS